MTTNFMDMKELYKRLMWLFYVLILGLLVLLSSCSNDDEPTPVGLTGDKTVFSLEESGDSGVNGTITIEKRDDNTSLVTIQLTGTTSGGNHPNHIHGNSVVQGGGISITLENIDGSTGSGITEVSTLDDGTVITYSELIQIDGHVKIHLSESDFASVVAEGDIGENVLTGDSESYPLEGDGVDGNLKLEKRESGETLATLTVTGASDASDHPAHIHASTDIEGGGILISFNNVNASTGISLTHISSKDDGTMITYDELIDFDGHVKVHSSEADFSLIASGDIGQNILTGSSEKFNLTDNAIDLVEGEVTFKERKNGETLVELKLEGPHGTDDHPAHIHSNTLAEGGGILISLNVVVDGESKSNINQLDDGTAITYAELIDFDGHVIVHASSSNMGTIIANGDIGENALTGETLEYEIRETGGFGVEGTAIISERNSGAALVSVSMGGGGDHPSHIHENSDAEGGGIVISLNNVVDGKGDTHVEADDAGNPITFDQLLDYNGHLKIHTSNSDFSVIAHADIGQNAFTGQLEEYMINQANSSGISGSAILEERKNGETLVTFELDGTTTGSDHPNHIHLNSLVEGGSVVISFNNINGSTGRGETNIVSLDDGTTITYEELINFDGHFKIHKNPSDFSIVAEGEAGGNILTGETKEYSISEVNSSGVSGIATFEERKNGHTLITLELLGTFGTSHPAHIHQNSAAMGGSIVINFANVDSTTGISINNVEIMNSGEDITYLELINFNGHIRVHSSDADFSAIAEGDIGSNVN